MRIYLIILLLLSFACSQVYSQKDQDTSDKVSTRVKERRKRFEKRIVEAYKKVKVIWQLEVFFKDSNDVYKKKYNLDIEGITKYFKLKLKNNLSDIKIDPGYLFTSKKDVDDLVDDVISIHLNIWAVGDNFPVAYYINFEMDFIDSSLPIYDEACLGYCSASDLETEAKMAITNLVENFAIHFYEKRGEL